MKLPSFRHFVKYKVSRFLEYFLNSTSICRAIPEAGYITLGSIRYGVKLSKGCIPSKCSHSRSPSLGTIEHSLNMAANTRPISSDYVDAWPNKPDPKHKNKVGNSHNSIPTFSAPICDSDNSSSDVTSVNGSCCLKTKCSLPWTNKTDQQKPDDSCT